MMSVSSVLLALQAHDEGHRRNAASNKPVAARAAVQLGAALAL